jgi:Bifunctional DNA primase/polymerase, N-terminal/Primase C terminal 1 (PriCT-1)
MLRTALTLAARGLHVFPCVPSAKTPACTHGCKDATIDTVTIQAWWRSCPDFNIGIATGPASNLFVTDVDGDDGEGSLRKLEAAHGPLPATVEVITPRGRHLYFKWPHLPLRNTVGKLADGIDTRGDGGYVLAPPSVHPSGRKYCWSVDTANAFAEAPRWLLDKITEPSNRNGNGATPPSEWRELVTSGVEEGKRNEQVTRLTGHLLRRHVDPFVTLQLAQSWNATHCRPPLPSRDVERIVNSIAGRELRRRTNGLGG